jgi:hypothetical protein
VASIPRGQDPARGGLRANTRSRERAHEMPGRGELIKGRCGEMAVRPSQKEHFQERSCSCRTSVKNHWRSEVFPTGALIQK